MFDSLAHFLMHSLTMFCQNLLRLGRVLWQLFLDWILTSCCFWNDERITRQQANVCGASSTFRVMNGISRHWGYWKAKRRMWQITVICLWVDINRHLYTYVHIDVQCTYLYNYIQMIECVQIYVLQVFLDIFFFLNVAVKFSYCSHSRHTLTKVVAQKPLAFTGLDPSKPWAPESPDVTGRTHRIVLQHNFKETATFVDDGNGIVTVDRELMMMMMMMMMM